MPEITERPILYSPAMARAKVLKLKTQTRRVVKPQPVPHGSAEPGDVVWYGGQLCKIRESRGRNKAAQGLLNAVDWSPYGKVGDRLWGKENFRLGVEWDDTKPSEVAVNPWSEKNQHIGNVWFEADGKPTAGFGKLRPSMFMPRWASRILDEIVGLRVERVQDITEDDAIAEGLLRIDDPAESEPYWESYHGRQFLRPVEAYRDLWDFINGEDAWARNDWVWVITTKPVEVTNGL